MQGRHDLLKSFYFDVLKCAVDPRKEENWGKGAGTLWANCGINQFHLPQEAQAQVFAGRIVLEYSDLTEVAVGPDEADVAVPDELIIAASASSLRFVSFAISSA